MEFLSKEKLQHIDNRLDDYWDYDFVDADLANEMQQYAWELLQAYRKLVKHIEESNS